MSDSETTLLFVYGTLLAGETNHATIAGCRCVGVGRTLPTFALHDLGEYPALVPGGDCAVVGEIYAVDAATLAVIDALEEHPTFYERVTIPLEDGRTVQTYLLQPQQVVGCPRLADGDWRGRARGRWTG